jgi:hypothetical protein
VDWLTRLGRERIVVFDGGLGTAAKLQRSLGLAIDSSGNMFVTDAGANRVRKIDVTTGL